MMRLYQRSRLYLALALGSVIGTFLLGAIFYGVGFAILRWWSTFNTVGLEGLVPLAIALLIGSWLGAVLGGWAALRLLGATRIKQTCYAQAGLIVFCYPLALSRLQATGNHTALFWSWGFLVTVVALLARGFTDWNFRNRSHSA